MARTQDPGGAEAVAALEALRAALTQAGIVLPSLGTEQASPHLHLIALGRIRADAALRLADVIRRGCA